MSHAEEDLNATREDVLTDTARLEAIEREKGRLEPDDPQVAELSGEAERVARSLGSKTMAERELAEEISGGAATG